MSPIRVGNIVTNYIIWEHTFNKDVGYPGYDVKRAATLTTGAAKKETLAALNPRSGIMQTYRSLIKAHATEAPYFYNNPDDDAMSFEDGTWMVRAVYAIQTKAHGKMGSSGAVTECYTLNKDLLIFDISDCSNT